MPLRAHSYSAGCASESEDPPATHHHSSINQMTDDARSKSRDDAARRRLAARHSPLGQPAPPEVIARRRHRAHGRHMHRFTPTAADHTSDRRAALRVGLSSCTRCGPQRVVGRLTTGGVTKGAEHKEVLRATTGPTRAHLGGWGVPLRVGGWSIFALPDSSGWRHSICDAEREADARREEEGCGAVVTEVGPVDS